MIQITLNKCILPIISQQYSNTIYVHVLIIFAMQSSLANTHTQHIDRQIHTTHRQTDTHNT